MSRQKLDCSDTDYLIVKESGHKLNPEELCEELGYHIGKWNFDTKKYDFTGILDLDDSRENFIYPRDCEDIQVISSPVDKMRYLYACMHNDDKVFEVIKNLIPDIKDVVITNNRTTNKPYINLWQEEYNFTLEEFISDDRFVVISEGGINLKQIVNLDLINWETIEYFSIEMQ